MFQDDDAISCSARIILLKSLYSPTTKVALLPQWAARAWASASRRGADLQFSSTRNDASLPDQATCMSMKSRNDLVGSDCGSLLQQRAHRSRLLAQVVGSSVARQLVASPQISHHAAPFMMPNLLSFAPAH